MDPLLIDVPERIETERLVLRCAARRRRRGHERGGLRLARRARAVAAVGGHDAERRRVGGALPAPAGPLHPARGLRDADVRARRRRRRGRARRRHRPAPHRLGAAPLRDRLLAQGRLRRARRRQRSGAGAGPAGLRLGSARAGSRSAWTTTTSAAGRSPSAPASRSRRCCASTRPRRSASRAARASMRACAAPRSRWGRAA